MNKTSKTNTNLSLNLSPSTSLNALAVKARRARVISELDAKAKAKTKTAPAVKKRRNGGLKPTPSTELERTLRDIRKTIEEQPLKNRYTVFSKPDKGSSAVAVVKVYDEEYYMKHKDKDLDKAVAETCYVFYPSPVDTSRLGSVAIYNDHAGVTCTAIRRVGYLFGIAVKSVSVQMGKRPFVDVTLRA